MKAARMDTWISAGRVNCNKMIQRREKNPKNPHGGAEIHPETEQGKACDLHGVPRLNNREPVDDHTGGQKHAWPGAGDAPRPSVRNARRARVGVSRRNVRHAPQPSWRARRAPAWLTRAGDTGSPGRGSPSLPVRPAYPGLPFQLSVQIGALELLHYLGNDERQIRLLLQPLPGPSPPSRGDRTPARREWAGVTCRSRTVVHRNASGRRYQATARPCVRRFLVPPAPADSGTCVPETDQGREVDVISLFLPGLIEGRGRTKASLQSCGAAPAQEEPRELSFVIYSVEARSSNTSQPLQIQGCEGGA
jgi:hypothetical protein